MWQTADTWATGTGRILRVILKNAKNPRHGVDFSFMTFLAIPASDLFRHV